MSEISDLPILTQEQLWKLGEKTFEKSPQIKNVIRSLNQYDTPTLRIVDRSDWDNYIRRENPRTRTMTWNEFVGVVKKMFENYDEDDYTDDPPESEQTEPWDA